MKQYRRLSLVLCILMLLCAGCSKPVDPPFDATAAAAPVAAFPLIGVAGLTLTPPSGFTANEEGTGWYAPDYPSDGSCITVHTAATNPQFASYTAEKVKLALETSYKASLEADITVTMDAFELTQVDGFAALRMQYHFTYRDIKMTCLQYLIDADFAYTVTCIQVAEAKWMTEFEAVCASLDFTWVPILDTAA